MNADLLKHAIPIWSFNPATDKPQYVYKQNIKNVNVGKLKDVLGELINEFGTVSSLHEGNGNLTVIIFEDKAYNWSARLNISEIMAILLDLRILAILLTDGAYGYINTTKLSTFPVQEVKRDVGIWFVKNLKINPTEYSHSLYSKVVRQEYRKQMGKGDDEIEFINKMERSLIDSKELKTIPICGIDHWGFFSSSREIWKKYPNIGMEEVAAIELEQKRAHFMADEIPRRMQEVNAYTASLTCCGNIPELICSHLRNYGVSYLVISPKITEQDAIDTYMKEIRGELSPLEELLSKNLANGKEQSEMRWKVAICVMTATCYYLINQMSSNFWTFNNIGISVLIAGLSFGLISISVKKHSFSTGTRFISAVAIAAIMLFLLMKISLILEQH